MRKKQAKRGGISKRDLSSWVASAAAKEEEEEGAHCRPHSLFGPRREGEGVGRVGLVGSAQKHMHPNTHALSLTHMDKRIRKRGALKMRTNRDCWIFQFPVKQSLEFRNWENFWRGNKFVRSRAALTVLTIPSFCHRYTYQHRR